MSLLSFLGVQSPLYMKIGLMMTGATKIGEDPYGNVYFEGKPIKGYDRPRRWVKYQGRPEASKIPPEWHGWMHHTHKDPPVASNKTFRQKFSLPHQKNMTGTDLAYRPSGHILEGGERAKSDSDYTAWRPGN